MTKKKAVDNDMVAALEVVLQQADWVGDRLDAHLKDEYDIDEYVSDWIDEAAQDSLYQWLDNKYEEIGPDDSTLKSLVRDACQEAVKKYMTEQIMLALLDEVRANMGKLLGRAVSDYVDSINQGESK